MTNHTRSPLAALLLLSLFVSTASLTFSKPEKKSARNIAPQSILDQDIVSMVGQVDSNRIASDIQTLVGFGTRNTCSDNSGASPGIGAARDWIQSQFAALPGMQVVLDPWTYTGCGNTRTLHNVIAWIPGVRFIDVNENLNHQHSPNDLYVYVTPAFTARVAQVIISSASSLARASTPPRSMVASKSSSTVVKLTWAAPASGPPVSNYVVSARAYTENFYRARFFVPAGLTSTTARVTQDLGIPSGTPYYVSIAAVDVNGHESLYAYSEYRCDSSNRCSRPSDALNVTATR